MFKVVYECNQNGSQFINTVIVGAQNNFEAKRAIETSEAGFTQLWHISCQAIDNGEVWLISQKPQK